MKVAITFFTNKRKKFKINIKNKLIEKKKKENLNIKKVEELYSNRKNINNVIKNEKNKEKIGIKISDLFIIIIISIFFVLKNDNLVYLATNIQEIKDINISKYDIISQNLLANINNYVFSKEEEKEEENVENVSEEELAMDMLAQNYTDMQVFSNETKNDIVVISENESYQKLNVCGVEITNYSTNRNIDFEGILEEDFKYFSKATDTILLYTTHTSESYTNSSNYTFEYTSTFRTTDGAYNMLSIATQMGQNLAAKGINNICSLTPHDYGEYNSAYTNSRKTVSTLLAENSDIEISIDIHRDAIEDLTFAPKVEISGYSVACLMLVIGIGYDTDENPYYEENLKLALQIQILANKIYPGLFRSMIIRNSVYNQDLNENSFLVEIGATGNTIDEAKLATRCLSNLLNILYRD